MQFIGKCLLIKIKRKKILVIGDLHLGYEEYLNRAGIFVTRQMFKEMIAEFEKIFAKAGKVDKVILLGDVKHDFGSIMEQERKDVLGLFDYLKRKCKRIIIIKGNHDKIIEPIARKKGIKTKEFYCEDGFCFLHGDRDFKEIHNKKLSYWILGHGHPAVKISDGIKTEKYKCFLIGKFKGKDVVIMPSFSSHNEGSDPRENDLGFAWNFNLEKFEVRTVQDKSLEVLDFGILGKL